MSVDNLVNESEAVEPDMKKSKIQDDDSTIGELPEGKCEDANPMTTSLIPEVPQEKTEPNASSDENVAQLDAVANTDLVDEIEDVEDHKTAEQSSEDIVEPSEQPSGAASTSEAIFTEVPSESGIETTNAASEEHVTMPAEAAPETMEETTVQKDTLSTEELQAEASLRE